MMSNLTTELACLSNLSEENPELYISDKKLQQCPVWEIRGLKRMVNHILESTIFELYRVDGPDRQGYLIQLPREMRERMKRVTSIEVKEKGDDASNSNCTTKQ
ncbi:hypothetical protein LCGC14_0849600 [marine sediment metagenome]|uniref:Uncharacterized protein n=1 Tax=marine sediment metagenome TaxID=412755 RepID=A0A0F9PW11_9ZZZZ